MAISQILLIQYQIWDVFGLGLKSKVFCRKKNENYRPGTHSAKMGADSLAKNNPKFIRPICPIGPKVWDIIEKRLHRVSVFRGMLHDANAHLLPLSRKVIRTITIP